MGSRVRVSALFAKRETSASPKTEKKRKPFWRLFFAVPSESPFDRTSRVLTPRVSAAAAASEAGGNEA
jgi:DNA-binding transcriptional regulator/RsmH inhibitor MraZ